MTLHPAHTSRRVLGTLGAPPAGFYACGAEDGAQGALPTGQAFYPLTCIPSLVEVFVHARSSAQKPPTDVSSGSVGKHWVLCLSLDPSPQWQLMGCHDYQSSPCLVGQEMSVSGMQGGTGVR